MWAGKGKEKWERKNAWKEWRASKIAMKRKADQPMQRQNDILQVNGKRPGTCVPGGKEENLMLKLQKCSTINQNYALELLSLGKVREKLPRQSARRQKLRPRKSEREDRAEGKHGPGTQRAVEKAHCLHA